MSNTANYNLKTWATSETTDSFNNFLFGVAGDTNSNMTKIDTQMKSSADGVLTLKNTPIKTIFANMVSDSYYTATILDYSAYVSGNIFLLTLDITCHDTLTININSIGTVSVMKYKSDGSIYNVSAGDIIANVPVLMAYDGTRWIILNDIKAGEISAETDTTIAGLLKGSSNKIAQAVAGTDYMPMSGGNMTGAINEALVSSMALSGTMNIGAAAGNYIIVTTGTGPITSFDVAPAGARRFMRFSVPATINYNVSTMLIPGATNLDVVSGDVLEWVSGGSGIWRCVNIERWNRIEPSTLVPISSINDTLTSTSTTVPLSANQGKVLKDLADTKLSGGKTLLWSGTWDSGSITVSGWSDYLGVVAILGGFPTEIAFITDSGNCLLHNAIADGTYVYERNALLTSSGDVVTISSTYPALLTLHTRASGTHVIGAAQSITEIYGIIKR